MFLNFLIHFFLMQIKQQSWSITGICSFMWGTRGPHSETDSMKVAPPPPGGPALTARLAFTREHQNWQVHHWHPVHFTHQNRFTQRKRVVGSSWWRHWCNWLALLFLRPKSSWAPIGCYECIKWSRTICWPIRDMPRQWQGFIKAQKGHIMSYEVRSVCDFMFYFDFQCNFELCP